MGNLGEQCTLLLGGAQWHKLSVHPIWAQKGDLPHSGDVCRAPSADLGKSHLGFAIMHLYQHGVKGDEWCVVCNLVGRGTILTIMGINNRTPSAELSKPWRTSRDHVQWGKGMLTSLGME